MRPRTKAAASLRPAGLPGAVLAALSLAAFAAPTPASAQHHAGLEEIRWMAGCWERSQGELVVEERWLAPRGGLMLGLSRTVRGGRAVAYEFLRITEREAGLILAADPSGQALAEFTATTISDSLAVFENPEHDFPQRILYRPGPDFLFARIEGRSGGGVRGVDFRMGRVPCD